MSKKLRLVPRNDRQRHAGLARATHDLKNEITNSRSFVTRSYDSFFVNKKKSATMISNYILSLEEPQNLPENILPSNNIYAQLPDEIASDRNDINRINRAGILFIKQNKCPPLNMDTRVFKQKLQTFKDVEKLADNVLSFLKFVTIAAVAGPEIALSLNINDLKEILIGCFSCLLSKTSTRDGIKKEICSPFVTPENSVTWVKFEFFSDLTLSQCCGMLSKDVELIVRYYTFYFPTVEDFDSALQFAEHNNTQ